MDAAGRPKGAGEFTDPNVGAGWGYRRYGVTN
jgi:hypothetical protein